MNYVSFEVLCLMYGHETAKEMIRMYTDRMYLSILDIYGAI